MDLTPSSVAHLDETRKWTMFVSVAVMALMAVALIGVAVMSILAIGKSELSEAPKALLSILPIFIISVVYGVIFYFLLMFSIRAKAALRSGNPLEMEEAFRYLKIHYLAFGIVIIVFIVIYVVAFGLLMVERF